MDLSFKLSDNSKKLENFVKDTNATFADIGSFSDIGSYEMECKDAKLSCPSKLFLKDLLGLTGCEISVNKMAAGSKAPFAHSHKENEELWIVLKGTGSIGVDGKEYPVKEGSFLKIAPAGVRTISATTDLEFLCVQTKAGFLTESTLTDAEIK
mgnify:FL=1